VKGFRTSLRLKGSCGTMKCTAFWGPMRLRVALLMCIILTCSASLVTFHYLLVTWGDCVEFGVFRSNPSSDPDNLRRSAHWDYFDHIYVLHSHLAVEREADIHASVNQLHLTHDVHWWDTEIDEENGHRGAWNSHKSIAQHALDNNYSRILIFEDDIKIEPFLEKGVDGVLSRVTDFLKMTPSWEVFFFAHNCKKLELTPHPEFVRVNSWSTVAYAMNKKGIEKLAYSDVFEGGFPTVDSLLFKNRHAYSIYPMVIEHKPNLSYTIKSNRTEDVNTEWRYQERILHEDALERRMFACASPSRRAWGQLLYSPPRL